LAQDKDEYCRQHKLQQTSDDEITKTRARRNRVQNVAINKVPADSLRGNRWIENRDESDYDSSQHTNANPNENAAIDKPVDCEKAL